MRCGVVLRSVVLTAIFASSLPPSYAAAQAAPADQFFDSGGVRLRYVDIGRGEPVILIHSMSDSLETWQERGYLDALATGFRVIAVDLRGHGRSSKPHDPARYGMEMVNDLVGLLDHLDISQTHLLGYSMGGYVAGRLATSFPDRVLSVTFGGSSVMSPGIWATRFEKEVTRIADALDQGDPRPLLARFLEGAELERRAADLAARNDLRALAAAVRTFGAMTLTPAEITALRMPILVITGSEDLPESRIAAFEGLETRPKVVVIDGATHGGVRGVLRRPEFVSAVREFLLGQRSARSPSSPSAEPAAGWVVPRTPWGDPDLEGIWPSTDALGIPLERSPALGTRASLTDEEYAARVALAKQQQQLDEQPFDGTMPTRTLVSAPAGTPELEARFNGQLTAPSPVGPEPHYEAGPPSRQASLIVDPPDGRRPPLTNEGARRWEALRSAPAFPEDDPFRGPGLTYLSRCITRGVVGSVLPNVTDNGNQIVQAPGYVVIRHEMIHEARVIPLDGRPPLGPAIRQYMGDSRGRWEGTTLVIETRNLTDRIGTIINGRGMPHSAEAVIVERLTRIAPDALRYRLTVDDPRTWVRPWTIELVLRRNESHRMLEYACHEGNYAMRNILSAGR